MGRVIIRIGDSPKSETHYGDNFTVKTHHEKPEVTSSSGGAGSGGNSDWDGLLLLPMIGFSCIPSAVWGFQVGMQQGSITKAIIFALVGFCILSPIMFCLSVPIFILTTFGYLLCGIVKADFPPPWEVTWNGQKHIVTSTFQGHTTAPSFSPEVNDQK